MVALLRFSFRKTIYKSKSSEFFLPLINPLMATFSETCASTSRKYVAEKGLMMPNLWQTRQSFSLHSSFFVLERYLKSLNFKWVFIILKQALMVTFSENSTPTFRKNVAEGDVIMSNFFKSLQFFWSQSPLLLLKRVFLPLKEAWRWLLSMRWVRSLVDDMKWNKLY